MEAKSSNIRHNAIVCILSEQKPTLWGNNLTMDEISSRSNSSNEPLVKRHFEAKTCNKKEKKSSKGEARGSGQATGNRLLKQNHC